MVATLRGPPAGQFRFTAAAQIWFRLH